MTEKYLSDKGVPILLGVFALTMVTLAAFGGWKGFSPIPFWDMWNGTLGFVIDAMEGKPGVWFEQHNEHRIVLSRILFWLDYHVFGGRSAFLILMNFVIVAVGCGVLGLFIKRLNRDTSDGVQPISLFFFLSGWLFFWAQHENFNWGFQSQFFLAQLIPLAALYTLARAADTQRWRDFIAAVLLGVLAAGTMANGIMTLPLMFLMGWFVRVNLAKRLILLAAAIIVPALYFWNYVSPPGHGSIKAAILEHPVALVEYTFRYLGSPFFFLFGERHFAYYFALIAGVAMALITLYLVWRSLRDSNRSPYIVALLIFVVYIAGTAFGTGGGRVIFGVSQAMSGRYTTPAILGWGALMLAAVYFAPMAMARWKGVLNACMLALGVYMLVYQSEAVVGRPDVVANREMAGLAIELGVMDSDRIKSVFPAPEIPIQLDEKARALGISPLNHYPYSGLRQQLNQPFTIAGTHDCVGSLDAVEKLGPESDYVRVRGWIFSPAELSTPRVLRLASPEGKIVGFALGGARRPDVAAAVHPEAGYSGFNGYVAAGALSEDIVAVGDAPNCALRFSYKP